MAAVLLALTCALLCIVSIVSADPFTLCPNLKRMCDKSVVFPLPEAVREGFHPPFGQAVSSSSERQSAQNTGHIYHPALGLFQQRQKLESHVNDSDQIHIQNLSEILQLHPFCWTDGHGPAGVIHQTPQTCRDKRQEDYQQISTSDLCFSFVNAKECF